MNNFKRKIQEILKGRNGADEAALTLSVAACICMFMSAIIPEGYILNGIGTFAFIAAVMRIFSKDIKTRRAENAKFLSFVAKFKGSNVKTAKKTNNKKVVKEKLKTHEMFLCPKCKASCFVPKNKGKVRITCPKCNEKFLGET